MPDDNIFQGETYDEIEPARPVPSLWAWMLIAVAAVLTFVFSYNTYNEELSASILAGGYVRKSEAEKEARQFEADLRSVPVDNLGSELDNIQQVISQ